MEDVSGYSPLPEKCELRKSEIHGYGVFATEDIAKGHFLGITHVADDRFPDGFIRVGLGNYVNHSFKPNLKGLKENDTYIMSTTRDIEMGEELTVDYSDFNYKAEVLNGYR